METLPSEILERIFSYCTHQEVVESIQNVCTWWREVAQSTGLWQQLEFSPEYKTTSEQIVEMLKRSPKLQNISLKKKCDEKVLRGITEHCPELRKLQINVLPETDPTFITHLQERCPKLERLRIPHELLPELDKFEDVGKLSNLKVLLLTTSKTASSQSLPINLAPIADNCRKLERFEFLSSNFQMNDLHYLLTIRQDTLHTLGVSCCNINCECSLPTVSNFDLQSLSLFFYGDCEKHYTRLQQCRRIKTVRALTIRHFYDEESHLVRQKVEDEAQLKELKLYGYNFDADVIEIMVKKCPLLKHLALISSVKVNDDSLKIMPNFKELSSLEIFCNNTVSDSGLLHLQQVQNLDSLRIAWCSRLTKVGYENILKLITLRSLNLELQDLAEFPWHLIPLQMKNMTHLLIYRCTNVNKAAVKELITKCPGLSIDVWWCRFRRA